MRSHPEFFRELMAVLKAMLVRGDYIQPRLMQTLKQISQAPIYDDERAALVLAKYETRIEDLLQDDDITPYSDEIRELMCACLAELRGEVVPVSDEAARRVQLFQRALFG